MKYRYIKIADFSCAFCAVKKRRGGVPLLSACKGRVIHIQLGEINTMQLDFLKELENIGAANAATSLSRMLDHPIDLRVPNAWLCSLPEMSSLLGDPEQIMVGSLVEMHGDISGAILFMQAIEDAECLSNILLHTMCGECEPAGEFPSELQQSALLEVANILCGSYINAVAGLTELCINCSVPSLVIDMAGALMSLPASMYGAYGDTVLILETVFVDKDKYLSGRFFLMPDIESHRLLMQKMGLA